MLHRLDAQSDSQLDTGDRRVVQVSDGIRFSASGRGRLVLALDFGPSQAEAWSALRASSTELLRWCLVEPAGAGMRVLPVAALRDSIRAALRAFDVHRAGAVAMSRDAGLLMALLEVETPITEAVFVSPLLEGVSEGASSAAESGHFKNASASVLLLVGGADTTRARQHVDLINRSINGSLKLQIPGASHALAVDAPEFVRAAIEEFLARGKPR